MATINNNCVMCAFSCQKNDYRGLGVCCQGSECRLRQCSVSDQCGRWRICQQGTCMPVAGENFDNDGSGRSDDKPTLCLVQ